MAAGDGTDVTELSAQARADRVAAGQVEPGGVALRDGTLTIRHTVHGGRVTLPAGYVRTQVQLLYATTAHRAQGVTVDTAHPLITPGMTREVLYVLASRARENTIFYITTHDLPFDDDARVDRVRSDPRSYAAREVLLNILATEGAALSATETIATAQEEAGSLATLVPRYLHAAHQYAEGRYRDAAIAVFGEHDGRDLIADPAWSAVVRRLFDAGNTGWEPARLLEIVKNRRELDSAESVAEVLTWRIDAHLATQQDLAPVSPSPSATYKNLLPWVADPPQTSGTDSSASLVEYLNDAAALITARVSELADAAIRERPAWMSMLGQQPADLASEDEWLRHVAIIAAYRDQHQVTTDDPRQVLAPYPEPGHAGHAAYWHAAGSVLAARRLAGLDNTGRQRHTDEAQARHPAYAGHLIAARSERGHLTEHATTRILARPPAPYEPVEATFARRGRPQPSAKNTTTERTGQEQQADSMACRPELRHLNVTPRDIAAHPVTPRYMH